MITLWLFNIHSYSALGSYQGSPDDPLAHIEDGGLPRRDGALSYAERQAEAVAVPHGSHRLIGLGDGEKASGGGNGQIVDGGAGLEIQPIGGCMYVG